MRPYLLVIAKQKLTPPIPEPAKIRGRLLADTLVNRLDFLCMAGSNLIQVIASMFVTNINCLKDRVTTHLAILEEIFGPRDSRFKFVNLFVPSQRDWRWGGWVHEYNGTHSPSTMPQTAGPASPSERWG